MYKIKIKALSINQAYQGRRFKTPAHKDYERELYYTLPNWIKIPKNKPLLLQIEVGFSSKASDLSNAVKVFEDVVCKKYQYNDKWHYKIILNKKIVKKSEEYIIFNINEL